MPKTARSNMSLSGSILPRTVNVKKRHIAPHSLCTPTRPGDLSNPVVPSLTPPVAVIVVVILVDLLAYVEIMDYMDLVDLVDLIILIVLMILIRSS